MRLLLILLALALHLRETLQIGKITAKTIEPIKLSAANA
jgi:hypothetical protein